jgi:hypothetical protein
MSGGIRTFVGYILYIAAKAYVVAELTCDDYSIIFCMNMTVSRH